MGVPYLPVLGLVGSDLLRNRDDMLIRPDPFDESRNTVVAKAYRPDVAAFHAVRADRAGNVALGSHTEDVMLAEASRQVIVTVEEVVERVAETDVPGTFLPSILVDAVVHAPFGAHPTGCVGHYPVDEGHMREYVEQSASDKAFAEYLEATVFSLPSHEAYLERFLPDDWRTGPTASEHLPAQPRKSRSA